MHLSVHTDLQVFFACLPKLCFCRINALEKVMPTRKQRNRACMRTWGNTGRLPNMVGVFIESGQDFGRGFVSVVPFLELICDRTRLVSCGASDESTCRVTCAHAERVIRRGRFEGGLLSKMPLVVLRSLLRWAGDLGCD